MKDSKSNATVKGATENNENAPVVDNNLPKTKAPETKAADKPKPDKAEKPSKPDKADPTPSAFGIAVEMICKQPDIEYKMLLDKVSKKLGTPAKATAVRTAHSQVKKVIGLLQKQGWKK